MQLFATMEGQRGWRQLFAAASEWSGTPQAEYAALAVGAIAAARVLSQVWPLNQAMAMLSIRSGATKPAEKRPKPRSDGLHKPSWGPLTFDGIKGMHYGDFFYAAFGLMVYYFSWPEASAAREWPALDQHVLSSWVALVLARNLALEISFYEFWHQLLFGALANEAVTKHRYSEGSPYEAKPGQKSAQMSVWRERFWCINGFCWSTAWECYIVHAWASGRIPACDSENGLQATGELGAGPLSLGCQMADPTLADLSARPLTVLWFVAAAALTTQFRGIHFFCVHRCMHPWWRSRNGLAQGDIGAFLYRWVHSLHHKSHNPGPWSSLSMHPVEHVSAATVGLGL